MSLARNVIFSQTGFNFLTGLVGYYKLDSNANDFSGKGYNGTLNGSPTFTSAKVNNGINFLNDATARYVDIADNTDFSFTNGTNDVPYSVSMLVYFHAFSGTGNWLINKRTATTGGDEWQLLYISGRIEMYKFDASSNSFAHRIATSTGIISLNTWYHIAYTDNGTGYNGGTNGKLYINGSLNVAINQVTAGTYTKMPNGTSITRLGQAAWDTNTSFKHKGLIDECAIWKNRELKQNEITELVYRGNNGITII